MPQEGTEQTRPATADETVRLFPANEIVFQADLTEAETEELAALWEASVRASHRFLHEEDFGSLRREIRDALHHMPLYTVRGDLGFEAFMGVENETVEMLFVRPDRFGKGWGKRLVNYAVEHLGVKYVDVNEQNTEATAFYRNCGFHPVGREASDPAGRPYPILHLKQE